MSGQVFISYASADKAIADRVCSELEAAGITCWIAPRNIEPGTDYPAAIVEGVSAARVLVLILSAAAAASPHILSEVGHAFNGKKRIIPFRLSTETLPEDLEYFLSLTQWLDAPAGATEQNLKRLTSAVADALAGKPTAQPVTSRTRRGKWLRIVIPAIALAAGLIIYWKAPPVRPAPRATSPESASAAVIVPQPAAPQPKTRINPADGQTYVWIAPGTFTMGCSAGDSECKDDEKPTHPVAITKGFWLGQTEVTNAAYHMVMHQQAPSGDTTLPVTGLTWAEAKAYCAAAGGRLPTEAEWEYAARAGAAQSYYGVISEIAWYAANSGGAPHPGAKKQANAFGLYDMLGNVAEWVLDRYYNKYDVEAPATGAGVDQPLAGNATAVARGGHFENEA
ncbi:MAG: hypothetical protein C5B51_29175, partial [Terriglobia bacterium]